MGRSTLQPRANVTESRSSPPWAARERTWTWTSRNYTPAADSRGRTRAHYATRGDEPTTTRSAPVAKKTNKSDAQDPRDAGGSGDEPDSTMPAPRENDSRSGRVVHVDRVEVISGRPVRSRRRDPNHFTWPPSRSDAIGGICFALAIYLVLSERWPGLAVAAIVLGVLAMLSPRMRGAFSVKAPGVDVRGEFVDPFDEDRPPPSGQRPLAERRSSDQERLPRNTESTED